MELPNTYIVLGTETTGLRADLGDRIMEIALVKIDGDARTVCHGYVKSDREPNSRAAAVNRITSEMLEDVPALVDLAPDLVELIGEHPIYAPQASFDMGFLNKELQLTGRQSISPKQSICTLEMAKRRLPQLPGHRLATVARSSSSSTRATCTVRWAMHSCCIKSCSEARMPD